MTSCIGVQLVRQEEVLGSGVWEARVVVEDEALEREVRDVVVECDGNMNDLGIAIPHVLCDLWCP